MGIPVQVAGKIDARLLPTPSIVLGEMAMGKSGQQPQLKARQLAIEFALGGTGSSSTGGPLRVVGRAIPRDGRCPAGRDASA